MMMTDDPFRAVKTAATDNREQVINVLTEHIGELELHLGQFPGPYDPLNSRIYIRWERLAMSWIGRVTGMLAAFQLLGVLSPEQYERLKLKATAAINHLMTKMVMEGRRP
jgi:hypothetical protein